jgi:hypothetical protein
MFGRRICRDGRIRPSVRAQLGGRTCRDRRLRLSGRAQLDSAGCPTSGRCCQKWGFCSFGTRTCRRTRHHPRSRQQRLQPPPQRSPLLRLWSARMWSGGRPRPPMWRGRMYCGGMWRGLPRPRGQAFLGFLFIRCILRIPRNIPRRHCHKFSVQVKRLSFRAACTRVFCDVMNNHEPCRGGRPRPPGRTPVLSEVASRCMVLCVIPKTRAFTGGPRDLA